MQEINNIQNEILTRLDAVADKMGVGVERLWEIFLTQSYIDGWAGFGSHALLILTTAAFSLVLWNLRKKDFEKYKFSDDDPTAFGVMFTVSTITCVISTILMAVYAREYISKIVNPEYFAWQEVQQVLS